MDSTRGCPDPGRISTLRRRIPDRAPALPRHDVACEQGEGAEKQSQSMRNFTAFQQTIFQAYLDERPALLAQLVRSGALVLRRVVFKQLLPVILKSVCERPPPSTCHTHCTGLSKAEVRNHGLISHAAFQATHRQPR